MATFIPLTTYREYPPKEMVRRASAFADEMVRRRTVRDFCSRPVPREVIEQCLRVAGSAPSGANMQPWHFTVVTDADLKRRIREGAEREEYAFYHGRAPQTWLDAVAPLGTDHHKPYLETAPCVIVVFAKSFGSSPNGQRSKNYYVTESVGIATGMLISAIHHAGLVSLTHAVSSMGFLNDVLKRPPNERAFLVLVLGYPAPGVAVPDIRRKPLEAITTFV